MCPLCYSFVSFKDEHSVNSNPVEPQGVPTANHLYISSAAFIDYEEEDSSEWDSDHSSPFNEYL